MIAPQSAPFAEHAQALVVGAGAFVGIAQAVGHAQDRPVLPDHLAGRPEVADVAVGELALHAADRDLDRPQARDEVHQVHVVAADVGERVAVLLGEPVLEIGVAVVVGLDQLGLAAAELAEAAAAVLQPGVQRAAVEPLVVLDADEQPLARGPACSISTAWAYFSTSGLTVSTCWSCSRASRITGSWKWSGTATTTRLSRRQRGDRLLEQVGEHPLRRLVERRQRLERLARETPRQSAAPRPAPAAAPSSGRRSVIGPIAPQRCK